MSAPTCKAPGWCGTNGYPDPIPNSVWFDKWPPGDRGYCSPACRDRASDDEADQPCDCGRCEFCRGTKQRFAPAQPAPLPPTGDVIAETVRCGRCLGMVHAPHKCVAAEEAPECPEPSCDGECSNHPLPRLPPPLPPGAVWTKDVAAWLEWFAEECYREWGADPIVGGRLRDAAAHIRNGAVEKHARGEWKGA